MSKLLKALIVAAVIISRPLYVYAQESLLEDINGDGQVSLLGFGDSITFGVGDDPGLGGYLKRLETLTGIATQNEGVPGEEFLTAGIFRFPRTVFNSNADIVSLLEGVNDAVRRPGTVPMRIAYQKAANAARAMGRKMVMLTIPVPCCDSKALAPFVSSYNSAVREVGLLNDIPVADLEKAWVTSCADKNSCELFVLPQGIHPNAAGYDVVAQTVAASLYGIDIFAPDGAEQLEGALGLEAGTVIVRPVL